MMRFAGIFARVGSLGNVTQKGNWSAFVLGATLGVVWTPCAGPVLASVLTLVALQKEIYVAMILLFSYALGAGLPMLAIAYGGQYLTDKVNMLNKYTRLLQQIFGLIIILLAVVIYFNYDIKVYSLLLKYFPSFNPKF